MKVGSREEVTPVPSLLFGGACVVLLFGLFMVFAGGWTTGLSWDETYHVMRMRNYLQHGWYLLDGDLVQGRPLPSVADIYVYAPVSMVLLHGWNVIFGADPVGQVADTAHAYQVRHLGVGALGLLGLIAAGGTARALLSSWRWGVIAMALLVSMPVWTGHSMFNIKDIPVATGYTLVTLGLVLLIAGPGSSAWILHCLGAFLLATGAILAVGTRPGMWVGLCLSLGTFVVLDGWASFGSKVGGGHWGFLIRIAGLVGAVAGAYFALVRLYPNGFRHPISNLLGAATSSANYRDGQSGTWTYVPAHALTEVPLVILALGAIGAWTGLRPLLSPAPLASKRTTISLLVVVQASAMPIGAIVSKADLYDGLRQLMFAAPAVAILGAAGLHWVVARLRSRSSEQPREGVFLGAITLAALALILVDQMCLFPYNYTYSNAVVQAAGINTETDYWRTSVRELAVEIPNSGRVVCSPISEKGDAVRYGVDGNEDCVTDLIGPLAPFSSPRGNQDGRPLASTEFWVVPTSSAHVFDNCRKVAEVTRWLRFRILTMSYVARCTLPFPVYRQGGVEFGPLPQGWKFLSSGWSARNAEMGPRAQGSVATVTMRLPTELAHRAIAVEVGAVGTAGVHVEVNGVALPADAVTAHLSGLSFKLDPEQLTDPRDVLTLTFRSSGGESLGMRISTLAIQRV